MRRILIVPVIAGILLTMSACGAKEETSTTASTPVTAKSGDSDSSTTEKKSSTTESEDDTTDTTEGDSGTGPGDLPTGLDNDCIAISTLYVTVMAQSTSLMVPGAATAEEIEELEKQLEEARDKADVPDEIAEDFEIWSAAWAEFGALMKDMGAGGMLDPANAAKFEEAGKIMEDPEVEAASKNIEAYVTENCAAGGLVEE